MTTNSRSLRTVSRKIAARPLRARYTATRVRGTERLQPYLYLLPAFALIALWVYWPAIGTARLSFDQWNLLPTTPRVPVGFDNYRNVVTLPEMGKALRNTATYILGLLPFSVIFPLGIAFLLNDLTGRMRAVYRAVIFVPILMAPVAVGIVWDWIMAPLGGVLNRTLHVLFGTGDVYWFRNATTAIGAIIGITGWKLVGFSVLIFTAGLANINREYIEAASVDGASRWQIARSITLPLLSPTILFMLTLSVLLSSQWTFPLINVLTQGGPLDATTNIYYLLYQFGFRSFNIGFSAAAAVLFFIGFGLLALCFTRLSDRFSFYDN